MQKQKIKGQRRLLLILIGLAGLGFLGSYLIPRYWTIQHSHPKQLVIMTPNSQAVLTGTVLAFEEKYGISVKLIQGGTGELMTKVVKHRVPQADLFFGGNYTLFNRHSQYFTPYRSKELPQVLADYRLPNHFATPYTINGSVLIVNNELAKHTPITSYQDLLNPDLKGKIAFGNPNTSSSAFSQLTNILLAKGGYKNPQAWHYLRQLLRNIDHVQYQSSTEVYQSVAEGKMTVGLTYEDPALALQKSGANVSVVYPKEGVVFVPSSVAIIKGSSAQTEAKQFIDYILSKEVQEAFALSATNRSIRQDQQTSSELKKLDAIPLLKEDYSYITKSKSIILKRFNQAWLENSRAKK
ncbi:extracellular solute-binding protein [Streptococcus halichoeri]|uniref:extracellular solute-binding protein n=1 Tax=Streptococcus halichoeri TaxID=254785 RepID=UPI00135B849E|nr:extracellular solute-binding protein [Streptococcus halichoeri]